MIKTVKCVFLTSVALFLFVPSSWSQPIRDSVFKVFVTHNSIDYYRPWQSEGSQSKIGSAVILSGKRILTNAHVVSDHTFVQLRKDSDPKKYTAKVLAIGHDCDLALLTVEDPEFFKGVRPIELGGIPKLQETVTVIGYPQGGDKLSITKGVISRLEITSYVQSSRKLLTIQIDAAINSGNSGGPVIQDGKLVGIAMQALTSGQNIGYMIPIPIIKHFFDDLEDGKYDGFPSVGIDVNNTENDTLRAYLKIHDKKGGILISKIMPDSAASKNLQEGDVILEISGKPIGTDGTFKFRDDERLSLSYLINKKQIGEDIEMKISRDGEVKKLKFPVGPYKQLVYPIRSFDKPPYYIYGGLVFTVLSTDLLQAWGKNWWQKGPIDLIYYLLGTGRFNEDEKKEIVVLLQVLPDDLNVGYHKYRNEIITKINGEDINSFKDLVSILSSQSDRYSVIETQHKFKIILDNANIEEINREILERNNIPAQYSADVAQWLGTL